MARMAEIWEEMGPEAYLLSPLAGLYALGWWLYESSYRWGLARPAQPHRRIVVVGNFMVGGTGKTPVALHVADVLEDLGYSVVLSMNGYGGRRFRGAAWAPDGELDPAEWGDEPALARARRPQRPLVVGKDRVSAARLCAERYPEAVLLLDDGLQHLRLRPHVRIALDPPASPNRLCLPAGPYRQPRSGLARVDLVLPGPFSIVARPLAFLRPDGRPADPDWMRDGPVGVLCAIGRPSAFFEHLEREGLRIGRMRALPDHDPLRASRLLTEFERDRPVVVTEKDWVKLRSRPDASNYPFVIARLDVTIEPQSDFAQWLRVRIPP